MISAGLAVVEPAGETLPALIDRAARALTGARSSAELLEAHAMADVIYDMAKRTARVAKAKGAHDALVAAAHRAQGDALLIESRAKHRLADEYDAAQERGEVARGSVRTDIVPVSNDVRPATAGELGFDRKMIHEARLIRDAEKQEPGIIQRTVEDALQRGEEPTKTMVREAVSKRPPMTLSNKGRELDRLQRVWKDTSTDVRRVFLQKNLPALHREFPDIFGA